MKFLFLIVALVAFVNADPRAKCMNECGVDPYLVKRVIDFHDYQYKDDKIMTFVLCMAKEQKTIYPEHTLEDENHRLSEIVKANRDCHGVDVCEHIEGHTFEELAWNLARCMDYKRISKHVTVSMLCADKYGLSKKIVEEMSDNHKKIGTKGDKKKDFYFCYFERFGWMDHDGKISKEAVKDSFKKTDYRRDLYAKNIEDCKHTCTTSWDIIKCFVDKIH